MAYPALPHGTLAGSLRIERVSGAPARFMRVVEIPWGQRLATAELRLEAVDRGTPREATLPLLDLARPFPALHRRLAVVTASGAVRYPVPGFYAHAAAALLTTEVPLAVVVDDAGHATRSPSLFRLARAGEAVARVVLDWTPNNWKDHLEKHFFAPGALDAWSACQGRHPWGAYKRVHAKDAVRYLRHVEDADTVDGLSPAVWPLVELYAGVTRALFESMLDGSVLHGAREGLLPTAAEGLWADLVTEAYDLEPGHEVLLVLDDRGLLAVARGRGGPRAPLRWRTTHVRARGAERLDRLAAAFQWLPGFAAVVWP